MGSAVTLNFLGDAALNHGELVWARSLYEEAVTILREPGDLNFLAYAVRRLAHLNWLEGDYLKAISLCRESLSMNQEVGDPRGTIACVAGFADIAVAQGRFERAVRLISAVEALLGSLGIQLLYVDKMEFERNLIYLRTQLDEGTLTDLWARGREMSLQQAIAFALEEA